MRRAQSAPRHLILSVTRLGGSRSIDVDDKREKRMTRTRTVIAGDVPARRAGAAAMHQSSSLLAASLQVGFAVFIALGSIGLATVASVMAPAPVTPADVVGAMAQAPPTPPRAARGDANVSAAARAGTRGGASPPATRCPGC
jgi:hypothetical protein